jgi:hypothetical protein
MYTKTFLTTIALVASMTSAAPAAEPAMVLDKRAKGGVYICTDVNWGGTCGYQVQPLNTCIHLDFPWVSCHYLKCTIRCIIDAFETVACY